MAGKLSLSDPVSICFDFPRSAPSTPLALSFLHQHQLHVGTHLRGSKLMQVQSNRRWAEARSTPTECEKAQELLIVSFIFRSDLGSNLLTLTWFPVFGVVEWG